MIRKTLAHLFGGASKEWIMGLERNIEWLKLKVDYLEKPDEFAKLSKEQMLYKKEHLKEILVDCDKETIIRYLTGHKCHDNIPLIFRDYKTDCNLKWRRKKE